MAETTKAQPQQPENYSSAFSLEFDVAKSIAKEQGKGLADFIAVLGMRLDCETQYSKDLQKVANARCRLTVGYLSFQHFS